MEAMVLSLTLQYRCEADRGWRASKQGRARPPSETHEQQPPNRGSICLLFVKCSDGSIIWVGMPSSQTLGWCLIKERVGFLGGEDLGSSLLVHSGKVCCMREVNLPS